MHSVVERIPILPNIVNKILYQRWYSRPTLRPWSYTQAVAHKFTNAQAAIFPGIVASTHAQKKWGSTVEPAPGDEAIVVEDVYKDIVAACHMMKVGRDRGTYRGTKPQRRAHSHASVDNSSIVAATNVQMGVLITIHSIF